MSSHDSNSMEIEPEGLSFSAIFGSMAVSVVVVIGLIIAGWAYAEVKFQESKMLAVTTTGYPTVHENHTMGAAKLMSYGKGENGRYIIPIERAMELEAQDASN